jgi:hypothetical protein
MMNLTPNLKKVSEKRLKHSEFLAYGASMRDSDLKSFK